jgi:hypothetical protein
VKLSADQQLLAYTMPLPGTVEEAVCLVRDVSSGEAALRVIAGACMHAVHHQCRRA